MAKHPTPTIYRHTLGRSLTELNMVLSILSILGAASVFSWGDFVSRHQLEGFTQLMNTDLKFARSQALALNQTVVVNFTETGYTMCSPDCTTPSRIFKAVTLPSNINLQASNTSSSFYPYITILHSTPEMATANTVTTTLHNNSLQLNTLIDTSGQIATCSSIGTTADFAACQS